MYLRALVIIGLIFSAYLWLELMSPYQAKTKIVGIYGLAPVSVRCPQAGQVSMISSPGDYVNQNDIIARFQSRELRLLKHNLEQSVIRKQKEIEAKIVEENLAQQQMRLQTEGLAKQKSRDLWALKGARLKLEAQINALNKGIKNIQKAVKKGRAPVRDLVWAQAELKSAQVQVGPQKNQEFTVQTQLQNLEKSLDLHSATEKQAPLNHQDLLKAYQAELKAWQQSQEHLNHYIDGVETIRAPTSGLISHLNLALKGQSCLAGEPLATIQPKQETVRLWQVNQLDQPFKHGQNLTIHLESPLLVDSPQYHVKVINVAQQVNVLPDLLQIQGSQTLGQQALFGELPKVYGLMFEAEITDLDDDTTEQNTQIPWGLPFSVSWFSTL